MRARGGEEARTSSGSSGSEGVLSVCTCIDSGGMNPYKNKDFVWLRLRQGGRSACIRAVDGVGGKALPKRFAAGYRMLNAFSLHMVEVLTLWGHGGARCRPLSERCVLKASTLSSFSSVHNRKKNDRALDTSCRIQYRPARKKHSCTTSRLGIAKK